MKFYNIKQLAFVAVAGLALTSCDKFLDKPSDDRGYVFTPLAVPVTCKMFIGSAGLIQCDEFVVTRLVQAYFFSDCLTVTYKI